MQENPATPSESLPIRETSSKRKHRPGLQRVQIACERCRSRKNKCDGKLPECSTCKRAGAPCIVVDRLTYRQYPRGHVEELEAQVKRLTDRVKELELERDLREEAAGSAEFSGNDFSSFDIPEGTGTPNLATSGLTAPSNRSGGIVEDLNLVPQDAVTEKKFVGDSSGLFFGTIVEAVLLGADYKQEQGPASSKLRLRVGDRHDTDSSSAYDHNSSTFPSSDFAHRLQSAYFTHRWPSLPVLHRPSFLEDHYRPVMTLKYGASHVSLFLTFMVFALGAIDVRRQDSTASEQHLEYFQVATKHYLYGLIKADSSETVQGLLLMANFAINESRSVNSWHAAGQAMRMAIDLGFHRKESASTGNLLNSEIRKRIFWSAYAVDRNISIALGRPCAIRDADIDLTLPLSLTDEELVLGAPESPAPQPRTLDMSTFIHIIRLRRLQSKIQDTFYSVDTSNTTSEKVDHDRINLRTELDRWIADAPRYSHPTVVTFQSTEWFQIAYSHTLLLLYRPSPLSPTAGLEALQICADAAISLINSYSSLYAKNKVTYTWIALHSLFMASVTMLYTLWASPDIRASTRKPVVKSNVMSCLALFEVMSDFWPLATRCYDIIDRLGSASVALFDSSSRPSTSNDPPANREDYYFDQISTEYMDWFGTRESSRLQISSTALGTVPDELQYSFGTGLQNSATEHDALPGDQMQLFPDLDDLFHQGFDMSIPMMTSVFGNQPSHDISGDS